MACAVYRTVELSLASFLRAKGHRIVDVKAEKVGRKSFGFEDTAALRGDVLAYANESEDAKVLPNRYTESFRVLSAIPVS